MKEFYSTIFVQLKLLWHWTKWKWNCNGFSMNFAAHFYSVKMRCW